MRKNNSLTIILILLFGFFTSAIGGIFDKSEYKSRRVKLMESISDGIAVFIGSESAKQNSNFIYFTGVEQPSSILIIDGMKKESVLFLTSVDSREHIRGETGVDRVMPFSRFSRMLFSYQTQTNCTSCLTSQL